jgi:hypothetical protein
MDTEKIDFWAVTPCSLVDSYVSLEPPVSVSYAKDGDIEYLQSGAKVPNCKKTIIVIYTTATTSYPTRKREVEQSLGRYQNFCMILEVIVFMNVKNVICYDLMLFNS